MSSSGNQNLKKSASRRVVNIYENAKIAFSITVAGGYL
jgi:hypothetical protein